MVKEILEVAQSQNFNITNADRIKFLHVINPAEYNPVDLILNFEETGSGVMLVDARLFSGSTIFFKMKATLQPAG
jgi:hypothetical protein